MMLQARIRISGASSGNSDYMTVLFIIALRDFIIGTKMQTKRFILSLIGIVLSLSAFAWDIRIGNTYYNIISEEDRTVALTYGEMPYSGDFTVPETINYGKTYKVVEISGTAFIKSPNLRSLVIGNNITSMPMRLSDKCPLLKKVTLNCNEYLKNANTPSKSLNLVFGDQVEEYVFGNDVEKIGNFLFFKCSKVKKVTLGNSIKSIGEQAFSECSNLATITIPSTIQSISTIAFEYCTSLKSVSIDSQTFLNQKFNAQFSCKDYFGEQVEKYTIGKNVTSIGNYAFAGCNNITAYILNCPSTCLFGSNALSGTSDYKIIVPALTTHSWTDNPMWDTYGSHFTEPAFTLHANEAPSYPSTGYYTTFYNSHYAYILPNNVKAYTAKLGRNEYDDEVVMLTAIEGNILPKGVAVLLYSKTISNMLLTPTDEEGNAPELNLFRGVDVDTEQYDTNYMLSYGQYGLGSYKMNPDMMLSAHKAFLPVIEPLMMNASGLRMEFAK